MARPKSISEPDKDGFRTVYLQVPPGVWDLASAFADELHVDVKVGLLSVLHALGVVIETKGPGMLGPQYERAYQRYQQQDKTTFQGQPPIDFDKLHTSTRTKSGYVGVYANGKGFRAMARHSKANRKLVSVGTFPTAERAAWARFLHYKKEQMPYGIVEESLDQLRELMPHLNDAELLEEVNLNRKFAGKDPLRLDDCIGSEEETPVKAIGFDDETDPVKD